ncbi:hypothetical protein IFO69_02905 [Echinicola sp. CAU 1574]|uniref:Uncharacterized protein n=1 Tax=Echinicola arenosa TaxID=2774144 RepID=A0ABR9AGA6_9BACT|nr:hypothetical protein [Echinicola arenosa]MBD8487690.1 hypothetical protein [Echinicola arenosa]
MNWKKISENWKTFTLENGLKDNSKENNYFYGKQEIYQAKEDFQGFRIFYKNKFNKSAEATAFAHKANSFSITTPVSTDSTWTLKIRTTSFWKRLFSSTEKLKIDTNLGNFENLIPLESIESLTKDFPDLEIRVSEYGRLQNEEISPDTKVMEISTGVQPEDINQIDRARTLMHRILENLNKNGKIKPAHSRVGKGESHT